LLTSIRQLVEQTVDQNVRRPIAVAISELQRIGNTALRHITTISPTLPRIPESQASAFPQFPQFPQLFFGDVQSAEDTFVATPLSASPTFASSQPLTFQNPPIISPPYAPQLGTQFSPPEGPLSLGPQMTASTPIIHQPRASMQSTSFHQASQGHRRASSSSAIPQSPQRTQAAMATSSINFPQAQTIEWEPPRRGHPGVTRRGDRRVGHSRSRSRPR
jgi:hypothetical protein